LPDQHQNSKNLFEKTLPNPQPEPPYALMKRLSSFDALDDGLVVLANGTR